MAQEEIDVYWGPVTNHEISFGQDWNMLYPDPVNLFLELQKQKTKDAGTANYFSCPATQKRLKNTYVFKNTLKTSIAYDFTDGLEGSVIEPLTENYIAYSIERAPTIAAGPLINFQLYYSFFAEESLTMSFTPPVMSRPMYTQYGTVVGGEFDIGQWFRPLAIEIQMWDKKGEFHLEEDEPLFYVEFKTDKKVNLKRFRFNAALYAYQKACSSDTKTFGRGTPMIKRYERFKQSRMRDLILKEVKQNLLGDV